MSDYDDHKKQQFFRPKEADDRSLFCYKCGNLRARGSILCSGCEAGSSYVNFLRESILEDVCASAIKEIIEENSINKGERNKLEIGYSNRGFEFVEFVDHYGKKCSLQKSSLATEDCVWLGIGEDRMHLTVPMVKRLLPMLNRFVKTGGLFSSKQELGLMRKQYEDEIRAKNARILELEAKLSPPPTNNTEGQ